LIFFVDDSSTNDMILISKGKKKNLNPNRVSEMKLNEKIIVVNHTIYN